jgi:hypothetical protein
MKKPKTRTPKRSSTGGIGRMRHLSAAPCESVEPAQLQMKRRSARAATASLEAASRAMD